MTTDIRILEGLIKQSEDASKAVLAYFARMVQEDPSLLINPTSANALPAAENLKTGQRRASLCK